MFGPTWIAGSGFIDSQTLPATGTYTIFVDPYATYSGNATLTLYTIPSDVSTSITPGGSAVTVTTTAPGQNANVTFSGTQNQRVSLRVTNTTAYADVSIKKPDGTTLVGPSWTGGGGYLDAVTLPATGTYTIFVNPSGTYTGNNTLTLYDVPADASGTMAIGGSAFTVTTTVPGQNGAVTFSGTASQQLTVHITSNTLGYTTVKLLKPDGTTLTTTSTSAGSFNLSTQTLPVTGTYTVTVDPSSYTTGSLNVSVTSP